MNVPPENPTAPSRLFLLSPASLNGVRAGQLTSQKAQFALAKMYRSPEGVCIEDAFAFMSALYFRGKIAYAKKFALPPATLPGSGVFIIAPGYGLVPSGWILDADRMKKLRRTDVDLRIPSYRRPLQKAAAELGAHLHDGDTVVLLGSIATGKYVDILWPIFGERLLFPKVFVGIGDMSRGALMLRAAQSGVELEYSTLDVPRHRPRISK